MADKSLDLSSMLNKRDDLDCYRIVISQSAIVDKNTDWISHIGVLELMTLPASAFGQDIPASVRFNLRGKGSYEIAFAWVRGLEREEAVPALQVELDGRASGGVNAYKAPSKPGEWDFVLEYRRPIDQKWRRASAKHPMVFLEAAPPAEKH